MEKAGERKPSIRCIRRGDGDLLHNVFYRQLVVAAAARCVLGDMNELF